VLRFEKYTFYTLVALALSIVLIPKFYVTGDGPSHTYNAGVLFDYVFNHNKEFYNDFLTINRSVDPNWTGHLLIGMFLQIMPYWLADKAFQVLYILSFAFGCPSSSFLFYSLCLFSRGFIITRCHWHSCVGQSVIISASGIIRMKELNN
jgi:hypothetical protein